MLKHLPRIVTFHGLLISELEVQLASLLSPVGVTLSVHVRKCCGFSLFIGLPLAFTMNYFDECDLETIRMFHLTSISLTFDLRKSIFSFRSSIRLVVCRYFYFEYVNVAYFSPADRSAYTNQIRDQGSAWREFQSCLNCLFLIRMYTWSMFNVSVDWIIWRIPGFQTFAT